MNPILVLLAEDHHLVREALRALLEETGSVRICGQAKDGQEALELAEKLRPDVVIIDIMMPNLNGLEATRRMAKLRVPPKVIILSQYADIEYVFQALTSGASGYVLKDAAAAELLSALQTVARGDQYLSTTLDRAQIEERLRQKDPPAAFETLTTREHEVLQLVVEGNTNRQIALKLGISVKTVEKHRFSLMEKLGMRDVTGLVRFAMTHGIIPRDRG